jgi:hypothetical protein
MDTKGFGGDVVAEIVISPNEIRMRAIFHELVLAEEQAMQAALRVAPLPDGSSSPFAPNLSRKGAAKRTKVMKALRQELLSAIANRHDMTTMCVELIYSHGETLGWPRR